MKKKFLTVLLSVSIAAASLTPAAASEADLSAPLEISSEISDNTGSTFTEELQNSTDSGSVWDLQDTISDTSASEATDSEIIDTEPDASDSDGAEKDTPIFDANDSAEVFSSGEENESLFSDEEQLLSPDVRVSSADTSSLGLVAGNSIYFEGASFGRQWALKGIGSAGTSRASYSWNWASPEYTSYYTDAAGNLHVVAYNSKENQLYDGTCGMDSKALTKIMKVKLSLPIWGGFYAAPDGYFYVAEGQENKEESTTKTVIQVLKYTSSWEYVAAASIPGGTANVYQGIYIPFDAGSLRMTMIGSFLYLHTGREMFGVDGVHHQSSISFAINTQTMSLIDTGMPYTSHSFNQFILNDGSHVYFLDHGDAYDRGLILSDYTCYSQGYLAGSKQAMIFPFMGKTGDNYTGCEVTGFALEGDTLITIGKSVPHSLAVNGETGYSSSLNQNIFMILTNKNTFDTRFFWVTQYPVSGSEVTLTEPKLVKVGSDRYAILYSDETSGKSMLHYVLVDTSGNQYLSKIYEGVSMYTDSQPVLYQNAIYWVSGNYDNDSYEDSAAYLYRIPVVTVPLTGITLDNTELTVSDGQSKKLTLNFAPADTDDVKDVQWESSNPSAASVSSDGTVTGKNFGSTVITASVGKLKAQCTVTVTVPASDEPLAKPSIKITQTRADKLHITWKKVTGAKSYRIYCKASAKGSYKLLAAVQDGSLSYDAPVNPGTKYFFRIKACGTKTNGKARYSKYSAVKSKTAIVPAPGKISCSYGSKGVVISWSAVDGVSGYEVYREGSRVKTLKASKTSWTDTKASTGTGWYSVYNYYVRAYRTVNGKKVYSKPSKTVNLWQ